MTEDLYAAPASDLEVARRLIEGKLQISLVLHESSWRGGDYFFGHGIGDETFTLQRNQLGNVGAAEEKFPHVDVILYIECTQRSSDLLVNLTEIGFVRLRHK